MKNRLIPLLVFACAVTLTLGVLPAAAQGSGQTVQAAIPPQAQPPVAAPAPARPPLPGQRPETSPGPTSLSEAEAANVRIDVTITYQVGNAAPVKRTALLTVTNGGSSSIRSGNQVAVPSTSYQPVIPSTKVDDPHVVPAPVTSFNYKSVGLNVDARNWNIQGNRVKMTLNVEFSAVDEKTADSAGKPPSFPTFSQSLVLILESGKPLIVGQSSDFVDNVERKQSVEVKATILR
jgi:hypothetical protein